MVKTLQNITVFAYAMLTVVLTDVSLIDSPVVFPEKRFSVSSTNTHTPFVVWRIENI